MIKSEGPSRQQGKEKRQEREEGKRYCAVGNIKSRRTPGLCFFKCPWYANLWTKIEEEMRDKKEQGDIKQGQKEAVWERVQDQD